MSADPSEATPGAPPELPRLEAVLFERVGGRKLVTHENAGLHNPLHDHVGSYAAAAVIGLVSERAHARRDAGDRRRIIPRDTALNGLKRYYDAIHEAPAQQKRIYVGHAVFLQRYGGRFIDFLVAQELISQLREPRDISMFSKDQREFLATQVLPETFAAQSIAAQTLSHSLVRIPSSQPEMSKSEARLNGLV